MISDKSLALSYNGEVTDTQEAVSRLPLSLGTPGWDRVGGSGKGPSRRVGKAGFQESREKKHQAWKEKVVAKEGPTKLHSECATAGEEGDGC